MTPEPYPAVPVSTPTAMPKVTPLPTPTSTLSVTPVQPSKVRLCPYSTKMPDYRDVTGEVTVPGSTNDACDLDHPWIMLAICALRCLTFSQAQAP